MKSPPLLLLALATGCVAVHPKNPEVSIPLPASKVRDCAVSFLISKDWRPVRSDPLVMVFEKPGTMHDLLFVDSNARQELTVTLLEQTNSTRLLGFGAKIIQGRTWTQRDTYPSALWHLDAIKASCLGEPLPELPKAEKASSPKAQ